MSKPFLFVLLTELPSQGKKFCGVFSDVNKAKEAGKQWFVLDAHSRRGEFSIVISVADTSRDGVLVATAKCSIHDGLPVYQWKRNPEVTNPVAKFTD